jgi:hypothetical protein
MVLPAAPQPQQLNRAHSGKDGSRACSERVPLPRLVCGYAEPTPLPPAAFSHPLQVPAGTDYVLGAHKGGPAVSCTQPDGYIISGELNRAFWGGR